MDIQFQGKYKSITNFDWSNVPSFAVLTGPNGSGKSQLLELLYNTIVRPRGSETYATVSFGDDPIGYDQVTYLHGEWELSNTQKTDLASIQKRLQDHYTNFKQNKFHRDQDNQRRLHAASEQLLKQLGKKRADVTQDEFNQHFPEILVEQEPQLGQKIEELFYKYRLRELELKSQGYSDEEIPASLGRRPWFVLDQILKEAELPFSFTEPSQHGIFDSFTFRLYHSVSGDEVRLNDLSSGEKVLFSLVFYLYNTQERGVFPKLFLLDEPDAHLHPTMSQQLLDVLKNVFVENYGIRVILTTHSPSTVALTPEECLFEMDISSPRIRRARSKNDAISRLTSGLVFVGEGTRYFLVEDHDDANFYSFIHTHLAAEAYFSSDIPLVFIPASTHHASGGKSVVQGWVSKLKSSGLESLIHGIIDRDSGNESSPGVFPIPRYSIENYLADPLLVYATLLDQEKQPTVESLTLGLGEEYKLRILKSGELQAIADVILDLVEGHLSSNFADIDQTELERIPLSYVTGQKISVPKWILHRRGKDIIHGLYNSALLGNVNFGTLFRSLKKVRLVPEDLRDFLDSKKALHVS